MTSGPCMSDLSLALLLGPSKFPGILAGSIIAVATVALAAVKWLW